MDVEVGHTHTTEIPHTEDSTYTPTTWRPHTQGEHTDTPYRTNRDPRHTENHTTGIHNIQPRNTTHS